MDAIVTFDEEEITPLIMSVLMGSHTGLLPMNVRDPSLEDIFVGVTAGD